MLDTVYRMIKIVVIILVCAAFMLAINALVSLITTFLFPAVVGEVLAIMSACLPFNALAVFGAVGVVLNVILSFLIAKKIFDLTSWSISAI